MVRIHGGDIECIRIDFFSIGACRFFGLDGPVLQVDEGGNGWGQDNRRNAVQKQSVSWGGSI